MLRSLLSSNVRLTMKLKLGWLIFNFYVLIIISNELRASPLLDSEDDMTYLVKLIPRLGTYDEAIMHCKTTNNGRLFEIQSAKDIRRIRGILEKNREVSLVHVGRIKDHLKRGHMCWGALLTPFQMIPSLKRVDCNLKLPFICKMKNRTGKRAIAYSYLYVKNNWKVQMQQLVFGSDGCWSQPSGIILLESRVVGGDSATYGSQPWQVEIAIRKEGHYQHHCSGVILTPVFILTAAHCFKKGTPLHLFRITTGDYDIASQDKHENNYEIEMLFIHPKHEADGFDNDIAIIKLKLVKSEGILFGSHVRPACIPTQTTPHTPGTRCVVSGWGTPPAEVNSNNHSVVLQSAEVELLSTPECRKVYQNYSSVNEGMICAGHWDGRIDSCRGDSGGPLVCNVNDNLLVLGLVSWGDGCAQPNRPGVYIHVQYYLDWIYQIIDDLS